MQRNESQMQRTRRLRKHVSFLLDPRQAEVRHTLAGLQAGVFGYKSPWGFLRAALRVTPRSDQRVIRALLADHEHSLRQIAGLATQRLLTNDHLSRIAVAGGYNRTTGPADLIKDAQSQARADRNKAALKALRIFQKSGVPRLKPPMRSKISVRLVP